MTTTSSFFFSHLRRKAAAVWPEMPAPRTTTRDIFTSQSSVCYLPGCDPFAEVTHPPLHFCRRALSKPGSGKDLGIADQQRAASLERLGVTDAGQAPNIAIF